MDKVHSDNTLILLESESGIGRIKTDRTVRESVRKTCAKSPVFRFRMKGPPLDQDHPNLMKTTEFPYRAG